MSGDLSRRESKRDGDNEMQIEDLLGELGINPVEVIIAKNSEIVPEDDIVRNEDEIKIIRVKHGG